MAVDLGCGPGPQTLALADIGFGAVIGVDTSQELLDELVEPARWRPAVRVVNMDLVEALPTVVEPGPVDLCVHARHRPPPARPGGRGAAHRADRRVARPGRGVRPDYRDLSTPLIGVDRFIPVRSDPDRIMLCALDYERPDSVTVNDLIYTRAPAGWELRKSSYRKLRIGPDRLAKQLAAAGFTIALHSPAATGMWSTVARKMN